MNTQIQKALEMAIEALEDGSNLELVKVSDIRKALKACKEALEQPAQEPHGWVYEERIDDPEHPDGYYWSWGFSWIEIESGKPVYTHPAPSCDKVSRLEVIDNNGRSYLNRGVDKIEFSYQDDGRTLKIFTNGSGENV